jgi:hypothetical protein
MSSLDPLENARLAAGTFAQRFGGGAAMMTLSDRADGQKTCQAIDPTQWERTREDCQKARGEWDAKHPAVRFHWRELPEVWPPDMGEHYRFSIYLMTWTKKEEKEVKPHDDYCGCRCPFY